jgi:NCS1 family nucleobase:cation symporter-1
VRKKQLKLADLYRRDGIYAGSNNAGRVATAVGCALAWVGLVVKPLAVLYDYAWFVGAGGAGLTYWLMMRNTSANPDVNVSAPQP